MQHKNAGIEAYREHYPFGLLAVPFKLCGVSKNPSRRKTCAELLVAAQEYLNRIRHSVRRADRRRRRAIRRMAKASGFPRGDLR
jgi:hypothetical protein